MKASATAEERGWKVSEEKTRFYLEQLAKNGMKVEQPSPALKADLKKVGESMIADWLKTAGPEGKTIIDALNK